MRSKMDKQADAVAEIVLTLPELPTSRDVLKALTKAYRAGWHDALDQSAAALAEALAHSTRRQAG
jgi:hypothetical protein